ncbi:Uncharacterised protein [Chromobacterium violaceum]|nr:Uncharacterised protein [Chromobacterium violaceum]
MAALIVEPDKIPGDTSAKLIKPAAASPRT